MILFHIVNMRGWETSELEKLISQMEDNQELLRRATSLWNRKIKEIVFTNSDYIDIKKIKAKYHNLKTVQKAVKQMQEQSGFSLKEDDCESSINSIVLVITFIDLQ